MRIIGLVGAAAVLAGWWSLPDSTVLAQDAGPASRKFAVVIGTSRYEDAGTDGLKYAHWDARLFAQHLKTARGGGVPEQNIRLLVNENATGTQIERAFRWLSASVGRRDQVYIFISGIGRATVLSKDGYIIPFDRPAEKEALSLSKLKRWLQSCCSFAEVYLFADACREQPVFEDIPIIRRVPLDNKINFAVRNLESGTGSPFAGLLASREKNTSLEAAQKQLPGDAATQDAQQGFGVFTYYLVQALQAPNKVMPRPPGEAAPFVEFLAGHVSGLTKKLDNREQKPTPIGKFVTVPVDWSKPGGTLKTSSLEPRYSTFPGLFAFMGAFLPGDMAAQAAGSSTAALLPQFLVAVADANLRGEAGVAALLPRVKTAAFPRFSAEERERFATAVEDAGQQIVARYGTGDQFPEDPRKVTRADFELAATLFNEARDLRRAELAGMPQPPASRRVCSEELPDDPDLLALEARRLFSAGRAALSARGADGVRRPGHPDDAAVRHAERQLRCAAEIEPAMAEVSNALGIAELLRSRDDENAGQRLQAAVANFRRAIELAPNWAYPRHNLALVYNEQGRFSAAEQEIRQAIERTPYYPYLYYNLGLTLQRLNKLGDAARAYLDAVSVFNVQINRYRDRADTWSDLPTRSRLAGQVAETLERNRVEALNALGSVYVRRKKFAEARSTYLQALEGDAKHAPARHNLALLYLSDSDRRLLADPKREAESLLRSNVDFHPSRLELADLLLGRGQAAEARSHYQVTLSTAGDNVRARLGLASALESLGEPRQAVDVLSWPGGRTNAVVQERLGTVQMKMGDRSGACAAFTLAQQLSRERVAGTGSEALKSKAKQCEPPR